MSKPRKRVINKQSKAVVGGRGLIRVSEAVGTTNAAAEKTITDASTSSRLPHEQSIDFKDVDQIDQSDHVDFDGLPVQEPATVWHYVQLLEHYKSFLMDEQGLRTSCTVHLINDFEIDDHGQVTTMPGYVAVLAMNIPTKAGLSPVACCSHCISKDLVSYFALRTHNDRTLPETHLFDCKHTTAIVQQSLATNKFKCSIKDQKLAFQQLSTIWGHYDRNLAPGWYTFDLATHSKGQLGVYLSNSYVMYVFATQRRQTGALQHYCFSCKKYGCSHAQAITHALNGTVPDSIQTIRLPARPLDSLISKGRYPCEQLINSS